MRDIEQSPVIARHESPKLGPHITGTWTTSEHFAHDNYQRKHLPQLCVVASGWKAKLLALVLFWAIERQQT